MAENSTAAGTSQRESAGGKGAGPIVMTPASGKVPDPEVANGANKSNSVGSGGMYPSPDDQITQGNAGLGKQVADLAKAVDQLTKYVVAQNTPAEPPLSKEEEELVKVLEDYFADLEKRLEAKMEERLVKHEESMKKFALVPVGTTPVAPIPAAERTSNIDPAMKKVEETVTATGPKFKSFDELAKDIASGQRLNGRI